MEMNKEILTRKELYDLVWSSSLVSLSKKYSISDNGLRKICIKMNIPLPRAGHWVKLQFGKKVSTNVLPEPYEGDTTITLSLRTDNERTGMDNLTPLATLTKEIKTDPRLSLIVPPKLSSPDKLIIAARDRLSGKHVIHSYNYKGVISCSRDELDIRVAPQNVGRALRFMDTLIKGLRARGHVIQLRNDSTYALVKNQEFKICFREKMKKVVITERWERTEYHPTDILSFKIDGYYDKEWKDGKHPLENYLPEIIAKLEMESTRRTEEQQYHQKMRDERREQDRLQQELQAQKEKDLADFKDMLEKADRWHKAINLGRYIDEVEQHIHASTGISEERRSWLEWARKKADWYNPFIEAENEMLGEVDRTTLTFKRH